MALNELFASLQETSFATKVADSLTLFPWIETIHVGSVVTVVGALLIVDLRLLGVAAHTRSIQRLIGDVMPLTWLAFILAFGSGFLLFASNAVNYAGNTAFQLKMLLLVIAAANMIAFHLVTHRGNHIWDDKLNTPPPARAAGAISLVVWVAIVFLGRWVGFTMV
jgi:hypothetical protein